MNPKTRNWLPFAIIGLNVILAVLLLVGIDWLLITGLENVKTIEMSSRAQSESSTIDNQIALLQSDILHHHELVQVLSAKELPTLQNIKLLQAEHKLSLQQMERVSSSGDQGSHLNQYRTVLTGTAGSAVRFLGALEDQYVTRCDQIVLQPANDDGSRVGLSMSIVLREQ